MKKRFLVFLCFFLFLSFASSVEAKTVVEPKQKSNGNITLPFSFEEGYVGGLSVTVKINGSVTVKSFTWNSEFPKTYTKHYSYDKNSNTLKIYIATGSNEKNLVDKKGNVSLGTIVLEAKNKTTYSFSITNLTIVDASYASIAKDDLEVVKHSFTYQVSSTNQGNSPTTPTDKDEEKDPPTEDDLTPEEPPVDEKDDSQKPEEKPTDVIEESTSSEGTPAWIYIILAVCSSIGLLLVLLLLWKHGVKET